MIRLRSPSANLLALATLLASGCSRGVEPAASEPSPAAATPPPAVPATTAAAPSEATVVIRRPELPNDIFFDDPLALAAVSTRIPGAAPPAETARSTASAAMPAGDIAVPAGSKDIDWAKLLPADMLVAEVNSIRDRVGPKVANVADFNNSYLEFPPYIATLGALAGIAAQHDGAISWKGNAKFIRDLAAAMASDNLSRGEKSFKQVSSPFIKVNMLIDGGKPADLPAAADETDFALAADFGNLMKRIEIGQNALKNKGSGEPAFKQNTKDLDREGHVLAALAQVIASPDYGYGDDPKFQQYAADMIRGSLDAAAAAESGDYAKFDLAQSAIMQSCTACHGEYRN